MVMGRKIGDWVPKKKVFRLSVFDVFVGGTGRTGRVMNKCRQELRQEAAHVGQRFGQVSKRRKKPFLVLMQRTTQQDLATRAR